MSPDWIESAPPAWWGHVAGDHLVDLQVGDLPGARQFWACRGGTSDSSRFIQCARSPNVMWLNLNEVDFSLGSGFRAVALEGAQGFALMGKINAAFEPAASNNYLMPWERAAELSLIFFYCRDPDGNLIEIASYSG